MRFLSFFRLSVYSLLIIQKAIFLFLRKMVFSTDCAWAVENSPSIFVYRKPRQLWERLSDDIVNIALHISLKNFEQQCNGINAHSTTLRGYLFHCGGRYACLIRVISAEFLSRGHSTYRRASACYSNSSCTFTGSTGVPTFSSTPATMKQFSAKAIDNSVYL